MTPRERVRAGEVISKGEFAQLIPIGPSGGYLGFRSEAQEAYNRLMDRLHAAEELNSETAKLVARVVEEPPVLKKSTPKIRLILIGILCPWMSDLFKDIAALASHYERKLKK